MALVKIRESNSRENHSRRNRVGGRLGGFRKLSFSNEEEWGGREGGEGRGSVVKDGEEVGLLGNLSP